MNRSRIIHILSIFIAIMGLQIMHPAEAGGKKPAYMLPYMTTPCSTDDGVNCYWDAHRRGNRQGHSFYAMMIGKKVCVQYWDASYNRKHGGCRNP